ncbi:MAG: SNF2 helicase-associated domain-containing protein [Acidimicrobiia bacterium]|nr:SNF2 helicase-associated domain-containing protein [Acidimicrobiia bacterium]
MVDDLAGAGLQVLWPTELVRPVELRPTVTPAPAAVAGSGLGLDDLLEVRWQASVDGEALTDEELAQLAEARRGVVRLRGRWVRADPAALARVAERRTLTAGEGLAAALDGHLDLDGETVDVDVEGPLVDLAGRLRALTPAARSTRPRRWPGTSAPTSGGGWRGSRRCRRPAWAGSSPTTWAWGRRSSSSPSCCGVSTAATIGRRW